LNVSTGFLAAVFFAAAAGLAGTAAGAVVCALAATPSVNPATSSATRPTRLLVLIASSLLFGNLRMYKPPTIVTS
jgi:hypothetical protein